MRSKPQPGGASVDIRISVAGNVDSGKSTLIGVFTGTGKLDNGNGEARSQVFLHKHEMESGRTSAVSQQIMGFTSTGRVTNHKDIDLERSLTWAEIVREAAKVITFFDLAGHEKYLKTTVAGMIGPSPDYCMLSECHQAVEFGAAPNLLANQVSDALLLSFAPAHTHTHSAGSKYGRPADDKRAPGPCSESRTPLLCCHY